MVHILIVSGQDSKGKDSKEEEKHDKTKKKEKDDKALTKKGRVIMIAWFVCCLHYKALKF